MDDLERWTRVLPLGAGAFGEVHLAWDRTDGRWVALKRFTGQDELGLLRFVIESRIRVQHPHLVRTLAFRLVDDRAWLVTELARGGSVRSLMASYGALPVGWVTEAVDQVLQALEALHATGVVHRDLKPANLLLKSHGDEPPHLLVGDFGIATWRTVSMTGIGAAIGTPGYLAPEYLDGTQPSPATDLFAVGVLAAELLSGRRLVHYSNASPDMPSSWTHTVPLPDEVPGPLAVVLTRMADPDPTRRYTDCTQARAALLRAAPPGSRSGLTSVPTPDLLASVPPGWTPEGPETPTTHLPPAPLPTDGGPTALVTKLPAPASDLASGSSTSPPAPESGSSTQPPTGSATHPPVIASGSPTHAPASPSGSATPQPVASSGSATSAPAPEGGSSTQPPIGSTTHPPAIASGSATSPPALESGSPTQPPTGPATHPPATQSGSATHPPATQSGSATHPPATQSGSATHPPATQSGSATPQPATQSGPATNPPTPASGSPTQPPTSPSPHPPTTPSGSATQPPTGPATHPPTTRSGSATSPPTPASGSPTQPPTGSTTHPPATQSGPPTPASGSATYPLTPPSGSATHPPSHSATPQTPASGPATHPPHSPNREPARKKQPKTPSQKPPRWRRKLRRATLLLIALLLAGAAGTLWWAATHREVPGTATAANHPGEAPPSQWTPEIVEPCSAVDIAQLRADNTERCQRTRGTTPPQSWVKAPPGGFPVKSDPSGPFVTEACAADGDTGYSPVGDHLYCENKTWTVIA